MKRPERRFLEEIVRMERAGMTGVLTGRSLRRATAYALESRGLVRRESMMVCDGDGFAVDPERWRTGWALTADGRRALLAESAP